MGWFRRTMMPRPVHRRGVSPPLLLAAVALGIVGAVALAAANGPEKPTAQETGPLPSFEVASIRVDQSAQGFNSHLDASRFVMERWRVRDLIQYAYDLKDPQLLGGPKWIDSERYDIVAKVEDSEAAKERGISQEQHIARTRLRVRDLLANRFGLRVHHSTQDIAVLALVVAKNGPKISEAGASSGSAGSPERQISMAMKEKQWVLTVKNASLHYLILALSGQPEIAGHILVDKTGLAGNYEFTLKWEPQNLATGSADPDSSSGSLYSALQEQLGLRLESRKEPVDIVVIDNVDRPSQN